MRPCDRCAEITPDFDLHPLKIGRYGDYLVCYKCYKKAQKWMGKEGNNKC